MHFCSPIGTRTFCKPILCDFRFWVRHIDSKTMGKHVILIAQQAQVSDPLHLILSIVYKTLIKLGQMITSFHNDVGFLNIVFHALHFRHMNIRRKRIPLIEVVGMGMWCYAETTAQSIIHTLNHLCLRPRELVFDAKGQVQHIELLIDAPSKGSTLSTFWKRKLERRNNSSSVITLEKFTRKTS